jgi:hypothetical protein
MAFVVLVTENDDHNVFVDKLFQQRPEADKRAAEIDAADWYRPLDNPTTPVSGCTAKVVSRTIK